MREVMIVALGRSAIAKAPKGALKYTRPESLSAQVLKGVIDKVPAATQAIDDVILGCAFPEGEQGINMARLIAAKAGIPDTAAAQTVNRFCSSGLQSIASGAYAIMAGQSDVIVAGGAESMSTIPMGGARYVPDPELINTSSYYMAMGHTAERVAAQYQVTREEQDLFALASNQKAAAAQTKGLFDEQIIPVTANREGGGTPFLFDKDEGIRPGTTIESLGHLRAAFTSAGTVTAGNSSQTSDGASFALLVEKDKAHALGLTPMARFVGFAVAGVPPEIMGIGPIKAIPKVLGQTGLTLSDIDLIELNEAFASQAIACIKILGLNEAIVNVNGGAIALGHPLGCTGAALTTKLIYELKRRGGRYGLVSMCIGGGQGAAGVFEVL